MASEPPSTIDTIEPIAIDSDSDIGDGNGNDDSSDSDLELPTHPVALPRPPAAKRRRAAPASKKRARADDDDDDDGEDLDQEEEASNDEDDEPTEEDLAFLAASDDDDDEGGAGANDDDDDDERIHINPANIVTGKRKRKAVEHLDRVILREAIETGLLTDGPASLAHKQSKAAAKAAAAHAAVQAAADAREAPLPVLKFAPRQPQAATGLDQVSAQLMRKFETKLAALTQPHPPDITGDVLRMYAMLVACSAMRRELALALSLVRRAMRDQQLATHVAEFKLLCTMAELLDGPMPFGGQRVVDLEAKVAQLVDAYLALDAEAAAAYDPRARMILEGCARVHAAKPAQIYSDTFRISDLPPHARWLNGTEIDTAAEDPNAQVVRLHDSATGQMHYVPEGEVFDTIICMHITHVPQQYLPHIILDKSAIDTSPGPHKLPVVKEADVRAVLALPERVNATIAHIHQCADFAMNYLVKQFDASPVPPPVQLQSSARVGTDTATGT